MGILAEAASTDVVGSGETPGNDDPVEVYRTAKLSSVSSAARTVASPPGMVASTQSLDDPGVNHPANASSGDRQQQHHHHQQQQQQQLQERYGHAYRSAQTAQDKRSRLSNVINNLRKKVPDGAAKSAATPDSPREEEEEEEEEDERTSVERNLESLQKYVMTMLSDVIEDDDEGDKDGGDVVGGKNADKTKEPSGEGDIEAAVVPQLVDDAATTIGDTNVESSDTVDCAKGGTTEESLGDPEVRTEPVRNTEGSRVVDVVDEKESSISCDEDNRDVSREKKEARIPNTVAIDRLSEHQADERANVDDGRGGGEAKQREEHEDDAVLRGICKEMLHDLVSNVESGVKELAVKEPSQELFITGLHCSLPLDKVVSVLQNCQTGESLISRVSLASSSSSAQKPLPSKPSPSTASVRLLCLYCDRKFVSISLRQRHTERVHQLGGGRRSERNPRKPSQNCQYCSERCADTLEGLFQHMVSNHGDKYHACVQCSTRFPTRDALTGHMSESHPSGTERTGQAQVKMPR